MSGPPALVLEACRRVDHGRVVLGKASAAYPRAQSPGRPGPDNLVRVGTLSKAGLAALRGGPLTATPPASAR